MVWEVGADDWRRIDAKLNLPTDGGLRRLAGMIDRHHCDQDDPTGSWRDAEHRYNGLVGERHMARLLRLPMDLAVRRHGNRRRNFVLADGSTLDVVTRSLLKDGSYPDLPRKISGRQHRIDLLALVVLHPGVAYEPEFAGWIEDARIMDTGNLVTFQSGIVNRVLAVGALNPPWTLIARHRPEDAAAQESYWPDPSGQAHLYQGDASERQDQQLTLGGI